jgi:hypothetical protein
MSFFRFSHLAKKYFRGKFSWFLAMIQFSHPSDEFRRLNPHVFGGGEGRPQTDTPADPAPSKFEQKTERQLQGQIVNLLRLKGIEPLWHRTDRKSAATIGWPDITFSIRHGLQRLPVAWEVKIGRARLSEDQARMLEKLQTPPNCWAVSLVGSYDEAVRLLRRYGIE